jgi:hypothetical protein
VSQPWQQASRSAGKSGAGQTGPASAWPQARVDVAGPARPWEPADAAEPEPEPEPDPGGYPATAEPPGPQLTGRGAVAGMLALFVVSLLVSGWLKWGLLAGGSFLVGSVAAAWYTKQRDLLTVAVSPPLIFFCALVGVKALTATGSTLLSTVEGTALTLASVAPWLFAGVVVSLIVAWVRGLPRCVSDLRRDMRPDLARSRAGAGSPQGDRSNSRRYR